MSSVNLESLMAAKAAFVRSRGVDEGSKLEGLHIDGCRQFANPTRVAVDGGIFFFTLRSFIVSNPWFLAKSGGRPGVLALVPLTLYFAAGLAVDASSFQCYTSAFCSATAVGEEMRKAYAAHAPADDILLAAATRVAALPIASAFVDADQRKQRRVELKNFLAETANHQRQMHLDASRGGGGGRSVKAAPKGVQLDGGEGGGGEGGSGSGEGWGFSGPERGVEQTWEVSFAEGEAWGEGFEHSTALEREGWLGVGGEGAGVVSVVSPTTSGGSSSINTAAAGSTPPTSLPPPPPPTWVVEEGQSPLDMLFGGGAPQDVRQSGGDRNSALNSPHPMGYELAPSVPSYYRRKARRDALQQMR